MSNMDEFCNTCGGSFVYDDFVFYSAYEHRGFCATRDFDGYIIQECCELCQQDYLDELDDLL